MLTTVQQQYESFSTVELWPQAPSNAEWQLQRSRITQLYQVEKKTLKEVREILMLDGFKATDQMYKRRFRKWGLDKKHKEHEVVEILRRKSQREAAGKKTEFILRGQPVDMEDVDRYLRRRKLNSKTILEMISAEQSSQVQQGKQTIDLVCRTPSPSPLAADPGNTLDATEAFYLAFDHYLVDRIESDKQKIHRNAQTPPDKASLSSTCISTFMCGSYLFDTYGRNSALPHWRKGFTFINKMIAENEFHTIQGIFRVFVRLRKQDPTIASSLSRYLRYLYFNKTRPNYSLGHVLVLMGELSTDVLNRLGVFMARHNVKVFQTHLPDEPDVVLRSRITLAWEESKLGGWCKDDELLTQVKNRLSSSPLQHTEILGMTLPLINALVLSNNYSEAEMIHSARLHRLYNYESYDDVLADIIDTSLMLAFIQKRLGKIFEAQQTLCFCLYYCKQVIEWDRSGTLSSLELARGVIEQLENQLGLKCQADCLNASVHFRRLMIIRSAQQLLHEEGLA